MSVLPLEGLKRAAPTITTAQCFKQQGFEHLPSFVGSYLDQLNCMLNSIFIAANESRDAQLLMGSFMGVLLSGIMIATYESFRPIHRGNGILGAVARCSSLFFLWGQRMTAGFAMPIHAAFCVWSRATSKNKNKCRPDGRHAWATLLSVVGGFLFPSIYVGWEQFSFHSLSVWQPFPLYILALSLILPRLLPQAPRASAVGAIAILCTVVSVSAHIELIRETIAGRRLGDVFLFDTLPQGTLAFAAHSLFLLDFVAVIITVTALVLLPYQAKLGVFVSMLVITLAAGPGAALILPWAYIEITNK